MRRRTFWKAGMAAVAVIAMGCASPVASAVASPTGKVRAPVEPAAVSTCPGPVSLQNGSFESPQVGSGTSTIDQSQVAAWQTTEADGRIEIWHPPVAAFNSGLEVEPPDGNQFAELAANAQSTLYQDVPTIPGQRMAWRIYHRARNTSEGPGPDTMRVLIGAPGDPVAQTPRGRDSPDITDDASSWGTASGIYIVPAGQTVTRFAFESVSTGSGDPSRGNFLDNIEFANEPCIEASKTVSGGTGTGGNARLGDILTYTVQANNRSGGLIDRANIFDSLPPELAFVPGSLTLDGVPLTDAPGDDRGQVVGTQVRVRFGVGATPTEGGSLPVGTGGVVRFQARVVAEPSDGVITNTAQVGGVWSAAQTPLATVIVPASVDLIEEPAPAPTTSTPSISPSSSPTTSTPPGPTASQPPGGGQVPQSVPSQDPGPLAATGSEPGGAAWLAVLLVGLGAGILALRRRRLG